MFHKVFIFYDPSKIKVCLFEVLAVMSLDDRKFCGKSRTYGVG